MSYIQNSIWYNSTTNFTNADAAIADMKRYLPASYDIYVRPPSENISFDAATQTLSFTRNWNSEADFIAFKNYCNDNKLTIGQWQDAV